MPGASFEAVTGRLGVGAIALLGVFFLVDGTNHGVFPLIETIGKSVTWSMIGVLPTVVVTYIVGVLCFELAELVLARVPSLASPGPAAILAVSETGSALLQQLYSEHVRHHELLKGSFVSFVILTVGCLGERSNMRDDMATVWLFAGAALMLASMSLLFANREASRAQAVAAAARASRSAPAHAG